MGLRLRSVALTSLGGFLSLCGFGYPGARCAKSEDIEGVSDLFEPLFAGDVMGPTLNGRAFDFDREAAVAADQMMVVTRSLPAAPILGFTFGIYQHIYFVNCGHRLQGSIDRGEANIFAT